MEVVGEQIASRTFFLLSHLSNPFRFFKLPFMSIRVVWLEGRKMDEKKNVEINK
jgi:hypothetical protein